MTKCPLELSVGMQPFSKARALMKRKLLLAIGKAHIQKPCWQTNLKPFTVSKSYTDTFHEFAKKV